MGESHRTGGDHHQDREHFFDRIEMLFLFSFRIRLYALNHYHAKQCNRHRDSGGKQVAVGETDIHANMLQPFKDSHQCDRKSGEKDVDRHVPLRARQRIFLRENQALYAHVDKIGDESGG